MIVYTDNIEFAQKILSPDSNWEETSFPKMEEVIRPLATKLFSSDNDLQTCSLKEENDWTYLFIVKHPLESQFDILIELSRKHYHLPGGILCLAKTGSKMHGFRNRPWVSAGGNIHLSVLLTPRQEVPFSQVGFTVLSTVSVLQTIDSLNVRTDCAFIKWINDILINDSKVSGVIAHTLTQDKNVTAAILGIGINVETTPQVIRDPFVPGVISLRDIIPDHKQCNQYIVFNRLIALLKENYQKLLRGQYHQLLEFYRKRSVVIDRNVVVYSDPVKGVSEEVIRGKVQAIGEFLELYLEGYSSPITSGRLILE